MKSKILVESAAETFITALEIAKEKLYSMQQEPPGDSLYDYDSRINSMKELEEAIQKAKREVRTATIYFCPSGNVPCMYCGKDTGEGKKYYDESFAMPCRSCDAIIQKFQRLQKGNG